MGDSCTFYEHECCEHTRKERVARQEAEKRLSESAGEIERLRTALHRIRNRASLVLSGELDATNVSVADYDVQVCDGALGEQTSMQVR